MTFVTPLSEDPITIDSAAVDKVAPTKAAIDLGRALCKVLYVPKDSRTNSGYDIFHCALFRTSDFEGVLHFLKEKALLPKKGKLRVTGTDWCMYEELIVRVLGLEAEVLQKSIIVHRGAYFLLSNAVSRESLFFPECEVERPKVERNPRVEAWIQKEREHLQQNNPSGSDVFPCIFVLCGSEYASLVIQADGSASYEENSSVGGRTLLGLGQAIVGTNNYDELMALAAAGNVANVDTTAGDVMRSGANSSNARLPPDHPIFHFGKLSESDQPLQSYERADLAAAVVRMLGVNIARIIASTARKHKVTHVIVGGNGVRGEALRRAIVYKLAIFYNDAFHVKFLRTGHTAAIGAMITAVEDFKSMQMPQNAPQNYM